MNYLEFGLKQTAEKDPLALLSSDLLQPKKTNNNDEGDFLSSILFAPKPVTKAKS